MKYSIVALVPVLLGSVSAQLDAVTNLLKPAADVVQGGAGGNTPVAAAAPPSGDATKPLGIKVDGDIGLDVGSSDDDSTDKSGLNVDLLGVNVNAKICLTVEVPPMLKALVDIGCPTSPPPQGHSHVWHPEHPGVYIDGCDDDESTGWHYVHQGEPKNPDQGHYVWSATAAPATATYTVTQGSNLYTSVEAIQSTTVCPVPAPSGYVPPATEVYVPLTSAGPVYTAPTSVKVWETQVKTIAVATATATPGSAWYGSSGSRSGSGAGSAVGTPAAGVCPGPNCPPGSSTVVVPVIPFPSGNRQGPVQTPGAHTTPVVTAGASRNVGGVLGLVLIVAALL